MLVLVLIRKQNSVGALCSFLNSLLFAGRKMSLSSILEEMERLAGGVFRGGEREER